jgi:hypothetical protein
MNELMQMGGAPMWAILLFGSASLLAGAWFALRPSWRLLQVIAALSASVLFSIAAGTAADLAAVGIKVPAHPEWLQKRELWMVLLQGIAESMSPCILGFSALSLVALACAVGLRRMPGL